MPVEPTDKILSFFPTITHPTEGLTPVKPNFDLAKSKANDIKKLSLLIDLFIFVDI